MTAEIHTLKQQVTAALHKNIQQTNINLSKALRELELVAPAINACVTGENIDALHQLLPLLNEPQNIAIELFLQFNPLGLAFIYAHKQIASLIIERCFSRIDPMLPSYRSGPLILDN